MTNEKWVESWSAARERGMAHHIIIEAACGLVGGVSVWFVNKLFEHTRGEYFLNAWPFTSPYQAIYWAAVAVILARITWSMNERRYRRLTEKNGDAPQA
jgi:hypothetical protein